MRLELGLCTLDAAQGDGYTSPRLGTHGSPLAEKARDLHTAALDPGPYLALTSAADERTVQAAIRIYLK